jgi:hypothetical protein
VNAPNVPGPWAFALAALAVHLAFYLLSESVLLERPREWLLDRIDSEELEAFVVCPWCLGFWLSLAGWAAWLAFPHGGTDQGWPLGLAVPLALACSVAMIATVRDAL